MLRYKRRASAFFYHFNTLSPVGSMVATLFRHAIGNYAQIQKLTGKTLGVMAYYGAAPPWRITS